MKLTLDIVGKIPYDACMKNARTLLRVLRAQQEPKATQATVARAAGMSEARYWQIENGFRAEPTQGEKASVATALGVKVSEIAWPDFAKAQAS